MSFAKEEYTENNYLLARTIFYELKLFECNNSHELSSNFIYKMHRNKYINNLVNRCYDNNIEKHIGDSYADASMVHETIELMVKSLAIKISNPKKTYKDPITDIFKSNLGLNYDTISFIYNELFEKLDKNCVNVGGVAR